jgi:CheY-like chemotaxis protein
MKYKKISGINILLIDDDHLQQDIIRRIYAHHKIVCDCCHNLQGLVELLRKNNYDLVLTDMRMPDTDGYGVLTLLRRCNLGQSKTIPVLVVTAHMDQPIDSFIDAGFAGCLYKPFSEKELIDMTTECVKTPVSSFQPDLANMMDGESNRKELLDIFIEDTADRIIVLKEAFATKNYGKISEIIHKCAPLWKSLRIGVPVEVLE